MGYKLATLIIVSLSFLLSNYIFVNIKDDVNKPRADRRENDCSGGKYLFQSDKIHKASPEKCSVEDNIQQDNTEKYSTYDCYMIRDTPHPPSFLAFCEKYVQSYWVDKKSCRYAFEHRSDSWWYSKIWTRCDMSPYEILPKAQEN